MDFPEWNRENRAVSNLVLIVSTELCSLPDSINWPKYLVSRESRNHQAFLQENDDFDCVEMYK